jgi:catechol 2,3-dioxygenase-like lactoylglutathione lyase family enzyme
VKISSISGLTCPVKDLDRTAGFYESLGFRPGKRDDHQLTCHLNWFWVTFTTRHDGEPGSGPALYLKVDGSDDFYGAVLARGCTAPAEPRKDRSGRREFPLPGPDGHRLAFFAK